MIRAVMQQALDAHLALRAWINAVPATTQLPAMPGVDGDWLEQVELDLREALAQQDDGMVICGRCGGLVADPIPELVAQPLTDEQTPMDAFENAIRRVGVVAACEWFGHAPDSEFTRETDRVLTERTHKIGGPL